jgi:pSer/pThr/pTyr-binding forkhead associated (FHA) protein
MKGTSHRFALTITTANGHTHHFPLPDGEHLVGRSPTCQIYISEASISRQHIRITVAGGNLSVTDLESLNGTQLRDLPLKGTASFKPGDPLVLGELEATVKDASADVGSDEVWLEILNTSLRGKIYEVNGPRVVIGRSDSVDFPINHPTISRAHAVLSYSPKDRGWLLDDRKSANGTFVNDVMVSQSLVTDNDTLRVGDVALRFTRQRPVGTRRRTSLLIVLMLLLAGSIGILLADLFGLLVSP